ncbi:beta-2-glycoprotein 1 isoform X1 [Sphaerodactylus townsendi]|uniref:beta-2-glycoprotein 1 isoform X1 n=1 Tax=Sphaerodactylus townsendi TaxID=933632 RepID=UPI00202741D7|nr:beta-2-glycoprotein 1 isoform X1 [Sphaerodactylus townsendi]
MMFHIPLVLWVVSLSYTVLALRVCPRPPAIPLATVDKNKEEYELGEVITYICNPGYVPHTGSRRYTCPLTGKWPIITLRCIPRKCFYPGPLKNGNILGADLDYQSTVIFSCEPGYILNGTNTSQCLADGQWSRQLPECQPVICPPPPISEFGALSYHRFKPGNMSVFQDMIKFECQLPLALIGNEMATCLATGNWSEIPECRKVICPYPEEIQNGFINFAVRRTYQYKDRVSYGCNPTYVMNGPVESTCEKTGNWSIKPTCKEPCKIPVKKATVLYNQQKVKVQDHLQEGIQHAETIWFFCQNKDLHCSYTESAQCINGNLTVPACFKERGWFARTFKTDVADMTPCEN